MCFDTLGECYQEVIDVRLIYCSEKNQVSICQWCFSSCLHKLISAIYCNGYNIETFQLDKRIFKRKFEGLNVLILFHSVSNSLSN